VDELDQQTGRGQDGDNAVEKRVFARLLEVMGDPRLRGKILWVAASNRPDLIDPAIKRSGRLDYKIPVLPPQPEERLAILSAQCGRHSADSSVDMGQLPAEVCEELVAQTDGWTGAELEKLVLKALDLTDADGVDQPLSMDHLRTALTVIRPSTKSIASMTKLALAEVDDLTLLPSQYRSLYDNRQDTVDREAEELTQARGPRTL
jgi:SpoVK/Ycf46/Vps4 family AAA+-type ATPase